MSFDLPSVKPKPSGLQQLDVIEGHYGVQEVMTHGLSMTRNLSEPAHPVQLSEKLYATNKEQLNLSMLRNIQGLHAPLRLKMELKAAEKVGRLPFLPSSGFMKDILTGKDEEIDFSDILNTPEYREQMCAPHAVVEKKLGLL